jgi:2-C-methyl-D-erythritol 4-phosphate cytidylyltransferase
MAATYFDLIIPAAGSGNRMQSSIPKPYMKLEGEDILSHTLNAFNGLPIQNVIIATEKKWHAQIEAYSFFSTNTAVNLHFVEGGKERHHSVLNALKEVRSNWIAIHDAVRPLVSEGLIFKLFESCQSKGSAIPALSPRDTVKQVNGSNIIKTIDRSTLVMAQTPQFFNKTIYEAAIGLMKPDVLYTDDASIVESAGFNVYWLEGERLNTKITYPEDIEWVSWIMNQKNSI